jgi:hypothetical protein
MVIICLPETHWGIILDRRAKILKAEGEDVISPMEHGKPPREVIRQYLTRPVKVSLLPLWLRNKCSNKQMLLTNPIVLAMSMYTLLQLYLISR